MLTLHLCRDLSVTCSFTPSSAAAGPVAWEGGPIALRGPSMPPEGLTARVTSEVQLGDVLVAI